jgi:hypothetical protein
VCQGTYHGGDEFNEPGIPAQGECKQSPLATASKILKGTTSTGMSLLGQSSQLEPALHRYFTSIFPDARVVGDF